MTDINITRLIEKVNPFDFSASIAERGNNAGKETWDNAKNEVIDSPLEIKDRDAIKHFFKGFGAWDDDEIQAWSDSDVDALVLQYASGDLRELQDLCPGNGIGGIDWEESERLSSAGTISGRIYPSGDQLFIYLGE